MRARGVETPEPFLPDRRDAIVLAVDDEQLILRLLSRMLKSNGYGVRTATTAMQALTVLDSHQIDLVVMDIVPRVAAALRATQHADACLAPERARAR